MTIGEIIKDYRKKNGISIREFARRAGISHTYICQLEDNQTGHGTKPNLTVDMIQRLANILNMDPEKLASMVRNELKSPEGQKEKDMEYTLIEMMAMEFLQMTEMQKKKQISDEDYAEIKETVSEIKQKLDFLPAALKSHEALCLEKIRKINTVRHALYETGDQDIIDSLDPAISVERSGWIQELRETRKRLREIQTKN